MADLKEDRLVKKRLAERLRKARIKSDPELYAVHKEKDRQRYYKRKSEGKIKPVSELDARQQRIFRERSRLSSNKHNMKKRRKEKRCLEEDFITVPELTDKTDDPLVTSRSQPKRSGPFQTEASSYVDLLPSSSSVVSSPLPQRVKAYRDLSAPLSPSSDVSTISKPCTRSSVRVIEKEFPPTPKTNKKINTKVIIRRLKYRMKKMYQLQQKKIDELKTVNERQRKQLYRFKKYQSATLRKYEPTITTNTEDMKQQSESDAIKTIKNNVEEDIKTFLEEDENSRMCSGKKEFITKKKNKKQRRYLNDSLKDLYTKFNQTNPQNKISYSSFCKKRPFWILKPTVNKRETCLCIEHENMDLMVSALKKNNLINEKSTKDILSYLCCDSSNVLCLTRKCDDCKDKSLMYKEFNNAEVLFYWIWQKSKITYSKNGVTKSTIRTAKDKVNASPRDTILKLEKMLPPYMTHCGVMIAQNKYIKKMKSDLTDEECIIHCDFSENYSTKYACEIQAIHFGGNRQQITLHTVVLYYRKNGLLKVQSICTLSESLRHDAPAIWEHLLPILKFIEDENLNIRILHFISDSPSGQYRNRKMFYIISKLHWHLPNLSSVTWNYTESGHGKGAPDGVGATLKRTADRIVAQGNDITSLSSLMTHLKSVQGIITKTINDSGIYEKELLIPSDLKQFPGTMKVHQAVWNANEPNQLSMRKMSCAEGDCKNNSVPCEHGNHVGLYIIGEQTDRPLTDRTNKNKSNKNDLIKKSSESIKGSGVDAVKSNKPQILSNILIQPGNSYSVDLADEFYEPKQRKSHTLTSDIGLHESDSFWTRVSTDCENIAPTVMNEVFSKIINSEESSDEEYNIF